MAKPNRLDVELVRRGLITSRAEARRAIEAGHVTVSGIPVLKPASLVAAEASIAVAGTTSSFVSRGGAKLDHALRELAVEVEGRDWLDAGASTGGFTDRLLRGGAARVAAVDVGYGQLDWRLRNDPRVVVIERTNVRALTRADLPWIPDGVVADLSFISLRTVLPALREVASADADLVLLVKPQFEAGRDAVGRGGVVRDSGAWRAALVGVSEAGAALGLGVAGAALAEPPGPAGNREFFLWLREDASGAPDAIGRVIEEAERQSR